VSAAALLVCWAISARLVLDLHAAIATSAARCALQLLQLGLLLQPLVAWPSAPAVLCCAALLLLACLAEALTRLRCTHAGMLRNALASLLASLALLLPPFLLAAVHAGPWWGAQFSIPLLAVAAFQSISSMVGPPAHLPTRPPPWGWAAPLRAGRLSPQVAALDPVLSELAAGQLAVESRLACGASRLEATLPMAQAGLAAALAPPLQQMSLAGLASLPGFMPGHLLASGDPTQAARYQLCMCFLSAGAAALASAGAVALTIAHVVDRRHVYRAGRLRFRSREEGLFVWSRAQLVKGGAALQAGARRFRCACCVPAFRRAGGAVLHERMLRTPGGSASSPPPLAAQLLPRASPAASIRSAESKVRRWLFGGPSRWPQSSLETGLLQRAHSQHAGGLQPGSWCTPNTGCAEFDESEDTLVGAGDNLSDGDGFSVGSLGRTHLSDTSIAITVRVMSGLQEGQRPGRSWQASRGERRPLTK
jgi:putative ABC transport system permease protein